MKQILVLTMFLVLTISSAFSQVLENAFIVEDKARKAQTIIEGKIISKHSYFTAGNKAILTDYEIEVYKVFKGNITGETITITDFGGEVGNTSVSTPCHRNNLIVGQTAIYFCGASKWSESPATNQIFSLASSQVIFSKEAYNGAIDKRQSYASREYVYAAIEKSANKEAEQKKLNEFEQQAENWVKSLERNLQSRSGTKALEYNFRNFNVQFPVVEFDITVKANEPDLDFGESEIFLEYSPQIFGNNVVMNSNIVVTKEALILSNDYSLTVNDVASDELQIDIDLGTNPVQLGELTTSEQKLCHLVVNLANVTNSGVIQFEDVNMQGKSYHFDDDTKALDAFETILTGTNWNYTFTDFTFSPQVITAGTGSVLTITATGGTDFGNNKGKVKMKNAEFGGLITDLYEIESQFIDWSSDTIKVVIPQLSLDITSGFLITPGSGPIQIEKVDAGENVINTFVSNSQINVLYAITNKDDGLGATAVNDAVVCLTDLNGADGMTFYLSSELDSIPNARNIIDKSLCLWREKSGVNFNLSDSVIINPVSNANDGLNIIHFVNTSDFSMKTIVSEGVYNSTTFGRFSWAKDIDIEIARSPNWHYAANQPTAKFLDFESAITHEFGHAQSLAHVIAPSPDTLDGRLMYIFINSGEDISKRIIDNTAILGAKFVLAYSDTLSTLPPNANALDPMIPLLNYDCIINSTNKIEKQDIEVVLFPNPFDNQFNITYDLVETSNVLLNIYDVTGKLYQRQDLGHKPKGKHNEILNTDLPQGVYLIQLQTDYGSQTIKVIKH